jgi:hypothetical protein
MQSLGEIIFREYLQLEYSCSPEPIQLGLFHNTMVLYKYDDGNCEIEWIYYSVDDPDDVYVNHIGLSIVDKELFGYDGVFSLPKEAVKLIRKAGFVIPESFL